MAVAMAVKTSNPVTPGFVRAMTSLKFNLNPIRLKDRVSKAVCQGTIVFVALVDEKGMVG